MCLLNFYKKILIFIKDLQNLYFKGILEDFSNINLFHKLTLDLKL
jgi:hypothetical protein